MKAILEKAFFKTVQNEIEARISDLGLELLEARARLESTYVDGDTISIHLVPRGDVECANQYYSLFSGIK